MPNKIPGIEEEIYFLGTPPFPVPDKKPVGPRLIQPPEGKKPHIKPIEVGGGPQWPSKPSTSTPVRGTGGTKGQPPGKPTKGVPSTGRGKVMEIKEKINPQPGHPLETMEDEVEMVMVVVVEDDDDDNDDDDDEGDDEDEQDTESVTESEWAEEQVAPAGRVVPARAGGGGGGGGSY